MNINNYKIWDSDNNTFLFLFLFAAASIYLLPDEIAKLIFLLFLPLAYFSKRDYLWLAFLFVLYDTPNYFFYGGLFDDPDRVPIYKLVTGISLTFQDLLILILIIKTIRFRKKTIHLIEKELKLFFIFFLIFLVFGVIQEVSINNFILTIRYIIPLILIYFLPNLMPNKEHWVNFLIILMPIAIFTLVGQIYYIKYGSPLSVFLNPSMVEKVNSNLLNIPGFASRFYTGVFINFFVFYGSLYLLMHSNKLFNKLYIIIIIIATILQPILSASRGYSLAYLIVLGLWFLIQNSAKKFRYASAFTLILFGISIYIISDPEIAAQTDKAFSRLLSVTLLLGGDMSAGGELIRITERAPIVINKFWESPIVGFGFSDIFFNFRDDHIAYPSMLLSYGIIGFLTFYGIFFSIVYKIFRFRGKTKNERPTDIQYIFLIGVIGLFIIHSTSRQIFGILLPDYVNFMVVAFFSFSYVLVYSELYEEYD